MNGHKGKQGFLFIENEKDKAHWTKFLGVGFVSKYVFSVSHNIETIQCGSRGKARFDTLLAKASEVAIFAIDADIDHFTPLRFEKCREIIENPHVIHTYGYSKESISNCALVLDDCLEKYHYFDECPYRFSEFLTKYSKIIYPAFLRFIHLLNSNADYNDESDFNRNIIPDEARLYKMFFDSDYCDFQSHIDAFIAKLEEKIGPEGMVLDMEHLASYGFTEETAYQFINGHNLEERIVDKIANQIKCRLVNDSFQKYKDEGAQGKLLSDRRSELNNHFNNDVKFSTLRCNSSAFNDDFVYKLSLNQLGSL